MPSLPRSINLIVIALSLTLLLTGAALAAHNDRRPPTADPLSSSSLSTVYRLPSTTDGAKLYQQWCSTCHGDRGQGLIEAWRASWPEGKQNCWQSKCHAANHPPDGFSFPKNVPALIGPQTLTKFKTAQDLYAYTRVTMPYWSPQLLEDDEYLAITAFLVEANYAEQGLALPAAWPHDLTTVPLHSVTKIRPQPTGHIAATSPPTLKEAPLAASPSNGSEPRSFPWLSITLAGLVVMVVGVWLKQRLTS